jgi:hypothetical protein
MGTAAWYDEPPASSETDRTRHRCRSGSIGWRIRLEDARRPTILRCGSGPDRRDGFVAFQLGKTCIEVEDAWLPLFKSHFAAVHCNVTVDHSKSSSSSMRRSSHAARSIPTTRMAT